MLSQIELNAQRAAQFNQLVEQTGLAPQTMWEAIFDAYIASQQSEREALEKKVAKGLADSQTGKTYAHVEIMAEMKANIERIAQRKAQECTK